MRGEPGAIAVRIRDGCRERDAAQLRGEALEPGKGEGEEVAALAGGKGMDLVDDYRLQPGEHRQAVLIGKQQAERFGRGEQDLGRPGALADLAIPGRVARARLYPDG